MYTRLLDIKGLSAKKSLFLFGPRSTGKTTLLRQQFPAERIINLLKSSAVLSLSQDTGYLEDLIRGMPHSEFPVIIDEIQKLPTLLDEVHRLIEEKGLRFILTGSSGRKLKASGVNLLAGRAWQSNLFPLCSAELHTTNADGAPPVNFDLERYLRYGGLPQVVDSPEPLEELDAYVNTYLREEIRQEALVQNLTHFSAFLKVAAASNTQQINYANIFRDTGIPASSVRAWFDILCESFVGFVLEPWRSPKRKSVATGKFYFFDIGVANFLAGSSTFYPDAPSSGAAFEHFIAMEIRSWRSYRRVKEEFCFWRSRDGLEVDFLVGTRMAIEVKMSKRIDNKDLRGLRALSEEGPFPIRIIVCQEAAPRQTEDGILILPWHDFLSKLWKNTFAV